MPVIQKLYGVARGLRSRLVSGVERARALAVGTSDGGRPSGDAQNRRLKRAEQQLAKQREQIKRQSQELRELRTRVAAGVHGSDDYAIDPGNVIWILGTARTGSTWLASMMEDLRGYAVWREPYVGALFGRLYYEWEGEKHFETKHFILGRRARESWLRSIRAFVLDEASARFSGVGSRGYLVIREPNGSIGAPLLLEALPESRMIFLVRDPRDTVASAVDAASKGSWLYKRRIEQGAGRDKVFSMQADALVERTAKMYVRNVGNSKQAYEAHAGPKVLVRYEDLRSDTLATIRRIYAELGMDVDDGELSRTVEDHSWERVPEEEKGEGKFYRKARPGSWGEDLTPEQVETVERITAPLLRELYQHQR